ncbi:MAG: sigma-70 family RNA polymerase sigma factor [Ruminococcaceae bacterium]|nr:sigma-70 family RNA polymerase sigma factor [Oscillospiraceae bacterium]
MNSDKKNEIIQFSSEDITKIINAYRSGDETAFDKLVGIYRPLIESMVSRCYEGLSQYLEKEDARQYALIAFSRAALSYNTEQSKVSFGLYAKICIGNALVSKLRSARKKHIEILPIEGIFDMADPDDISSHIIDRENVGNLSELIRSTLSDFENDVFKLYANGYSSFEIADRLGKTEKSVDNAIFRARNKLKTVLNESPTGFRFNKINPQKADKHTK